MDEEQGLSSPIGRGIRGIRRSISSNIFGGRQSPQIQGDSISSNLIQKNSAESWANDPFNTRKLATIDGKDAEDLLEALEVEITRNNNYYLNSVGNQKKEFSVRNANLLDAQAFLKDKIEAYNLEQVGSEDMVLDNLQLDKLSELTSDQLLGNIQIIRKRLKSILPVEGGTLNENQINGKEQTVTKAPK